MKKIILPAALCAAALSACQSFTYEPIVPNPPNMEMTQAQCQMLSTGTQQGVIAFGSTSYVAGAQLGNAIGNAIRADEFVKQCMTINGWRRVPLPSQQSGPVKKPEQIKYSPLTGSPMKGPGNFPAAPAPYVSRPMAPRVSQQYILGPRGGCYYLTGSGNKEYVDRGLCH